MSDTIEYRPEEGPGGKKWKNMKLFAILNLKASGHSGAGTRTRRQHELIQGVIASSFRDPPSILVLSKTMKIQ